MIVKAIGFLVGLLDALGRAGELQARLAIVLHFVGIITAMLVGYFNQEWAVNSTITLFVDYLISAVFGEVVGELIKGILSMK